MPASRRADRRAAELAESAERSKVRSVGAIRGPSGDPRIRRARTSDLEAILALEEACFEPYRRASRDSLRRSLSSPRQSVWVVDAPGGTASAGTGRSRTGHARSEGPSRLHALLVLWHLPKAVRIYDVATHPDARGQGLGSLLLSEAERQAKEAGAARLILEAEEQDPRLVGWYESRGYAVQARFKDYYHRGCSALRLSKDL